jgi:hypothetical protein
VGEEVSEGVLETVAVMLSLCDAEIEDVGDSEVVGVLVSDGVGEVEAVGEAVDVGVKLGVTLAVNVSVIVNEGLSESVKV